VKVRASPQRRAKFAETCRIQGLKEKNLILDVKTRWNSTYDMMKRALEMKKVI
jgi:hypothetical protein